MDHIVCLVVRATKGTASACFTWQLGALSPGSVVSIHLLTGFTRSCKVCGMNGDTMTNETGINSQHTKLTGTDTS